VVIDTDCTGSCKFNYHSITTKKAPNVESRRSYISVLGYRICLFMWFIYLILELYRHCGTFVFHFINKKYNICKYILAHLYTTAGFPHLGRSWLWSNDSWTYNYLCNQCLSPLKLWVRTPFIARCIRYNTVPRRDLNSHNWYTAVPIA
jgi:hypothetical protein